MTAFLQDLDGHRMMRDPPTNTVMSGPTLRVYPASASGTRSNDFAVSGPPSYHTRSASGYGSAPGLSRGGTSYNSEPSITTSKGVGYLPKIEDRTLSIGDQDVLILPTLTYECPFDRLGCKRTFLSFESWYEHSLEHFQGHEPPSRSSCTFCNEKFEDQNGKRSWKMRLQHIKSRHHNREHQIVTAGFDKELYRYLWSKNIISDVQFKDITGGSGVSAASGSQTHLTANDGARRHRARPR